MIHSNPTEIYKYLGEDPKKTLSEIVAKFAPKIKTTLEARSPLPKRLLMVASQFPEVVINLGSELPFSDPQLAQVVRSNTMISFYLLISNYTKLADQLEAIILNDGQYTLELLQQASRHQIKLNHTLDYYEKALVRDPYFANAYNHLIPKRQILRHYEKSSILSDDPKTYAEAFLQLSIAKSTGAPLDEKRLHLCEELLHTHPLYAFIGATRLKTMGITIDASKVKNLTPRYACALLRYGVVSNRDKLIEKLLTNPLWMGHYILISTPEITPKEIRELHARMKQAIGDTNNNKGFAIATQAISNYLKTAE